MAVNIKNSPLPPHNTLSEYDEQIEKCRDIFRKKAIDYGTSWRVMRLSTLLDQIFIKAKRIRSIEEKQRQEVGDSIESEYIGIVNYCIITLIQISLGDTLDDAMDLDKLFALYDKYFQEAKDLMIAKNHDYGEAWRDMFTSSFTDLILTRILRMRQILKNDGKTLVSEGVEANLTDMINYGVFALIKTTPNPRPNGMAGQA